MPIVVHPRDVIDGDARKRRACRARRAPRQPRRRSARSSPSTSSCRAMRSAIGAERGAHRHLAAAGRRLNEHQVGDVGARDEQQQQDGGAEIHQAGAHVADDRLLQRHHRRAALIVGSRVRLRWASMAIRSRSCAGLGDGAIPVSARATTEMKCWARVAISSGRSPSGRHASIARSGKSKPRGITPTTRYGSSTPPKTRPTTAGSPPKCASHVAWLSTKTRGPGGTIVRGEAAAEEWRHAKRVEEVGRHDGDVGVEWLPAGLHRAAPVTASRRPSLEASASPVRQSSKLAGATASAACR